MGRGVGVRQQRCEKIKLKYEFISPNVAVIPSSHVGPVESVCSLKVKAALCPAACVTGLIIDSVFIDSSSLKLLHNSCQCQRIA